MGGITCVNYGLIKNLNITTASSSTVAVGRYAAGNEINFGLIAGYNGTTTSVPSTQRDVSGQIRECNGFLNGTFYYEDEIVPTAVTRVGGLVGYNAGIVDSCFYGGYNNNSTSQTSRTTNFNIETNTATDYFGGICGYATSTITNCYTMGTYYVSSPSNSYIGLICGNGNGYTKSCVSIGTLSNGSTKYGTNNTTVFSSTKQSRATLEGAGFNFNYPWSWNGTGTTCVPRLMSMEKAITVDKGSVTAPSTLAKADYPLAYERYPDYTIYEVNSLAKFRYMMNNISSITAKTVYAITTDIIIDDGYSDMSAVNRASVINPQVVIDGGFNKTNGHSTITGLKFELDYTNGVGSSQVIGLFAKTNGAIKNLRFDDVYLGYDAIRHQDSSSITRSTIDEISLFGQVGATGLLEDVEVDCDINIFSQYYDCKDNWIIAATLYSQIVDTPAASAILVNGAKVTGNMNLYVGQYNHYGYFGGAFGRIYGKSGQFRQVAVETNMYMLTGRTIASTETYLRIGGVASCSNYADFYDCYYGSTKTTFSASSADSAQDNIGMFMGQNDNTGTMYFNCYTYANSLSIPSGTYADAFVSYKPSGATYSNCYQFNNSTGGLTETSGITIKNLNSRGSIPTAWDTKLIWFQLDTELPTFWIHNEHGRKVVLNTSLQASKVALSTVTTYRQTVPVKSCTAVAANNGTSSTTSAVQDVFYTDIRVANQFTSSSVKINNAAVSAAAGNHLYFYLSKAAMNDALGGAVRDKFVLKVNYTYHPSYVTASTGATPVNLFKEEDSSSDVGVQKTEGGLALNFPKTADSENKAYSCYRWRDITVNVDVGNTKYGVILSAPSLYTMSGSSNTLSGGKNLPYTIQVTRASDNTTVKPSKSITSYYGSASVENFKTFSPNVGGTAVSELKLYYGDTLRISFERGQSGIPFNINRFAPSTNICTNWGWYRTTAQLTATQVLDGKSGSTVYTLYDADDTDATDTAHHSVSSANNSNNINYLEFKITPNTATKYATYSDNGKKDQDLPDYNNPVFVNLNYERRRKQ